MKTGLHTVLTQDPNIRQEIFDDTLNPRKFVDIVFSLIIASLIRQDYDDSAILQMLRKLLY